MLPPLALGAGTWLTFVLNPILHSVLYNKQSQYQGKQKRESRRSSRHLLPNHQPVPCTAIIPSLENFVNLSVLFDGLSNRIDRVQTH